VAAALRLVQLEQLGERLPKQLSGGQQQRVALARALVFDPDLLLMDEPLGALDKNLREQMQFELKRLHGDLGITIVFVTHDQEEALTLSDRVALMKDGNIVQVGSAEDLYERPATRFAAEFIGESNVIDGRVEGGRFIGDGGLHLRCPSDAPRSATLMVVRPEKFALVSEGSPGAISGRVVGLVYAGDVTRYLVELASGHRVIVKTQNRRASERMQQEQDVGVLLDPTDVRLLTS